jgi:lambda family phage portal protein
MSKLIIADRFDTYEHTPKKRVVEVRPNVRAKYDAAQTSAENQTHWGMADALSADAGLSPTIRSVLRKRSRYEVANNTYAAGMVQTLANDTIGTGASLHVLTGDKVADTEIETRFWEWSKQINLHQKLRVMRMAKATDGEAIAVLFFNLAKQYPVKIDMRLYESEQLAAPPGNTSNLSDGIVFDDYGNILGYTFFNKHPGSGSSDKSMTTLAAADVIHIFHAIRPGQTRGLPEITPAIPLYAQLRRYTLAVLAAAETAADIAGVIHSNGNAIDPDDIEPLDTIDIAKRQLLTMPKGWDISQLKAEQPVTTYEMFKRNIISEIARCLNMPYNVAAGDSSNYNYSSGRLDHKTYYKTVRVERSNWENVALDPLFEKWWAEARLIPGYITSSIRSEEISPAHAWRWDGDETIDPLKDANADGVRLSDHTTTLADIYSRQGKDWEEQLRQRAKEVELMDELGLIRDLNPEAFGDMNKAPKQAVEVKPDGEE